MNKETITYDQITPICLSTHERKLACITIVAILILYAYHVLAL